MRCIFDLTWTTFPNWWTSCSPARCAYAEMGRHSRPKFNWRVFDMGKAVDLYTSLSYYLTSLLYLFSRDTLSINVPPQQFEETKLPYAKCFWEVLLQTHRPSKLNAIKVDYKGYPLIQIQDTNIVHVQSAIWILYPNNLKLYTWSRNTIAIFWYTHPCIF